MLVLQDPLRGSRAHVQTMGIDIGGSGIKGAPVDLENGELAGERHRTKTPQPSTPEAVIEVVKDVITFHAWDGLVGITLPSVVIDGIAWSAANIDEGWIGFDAQSAFGEALGVPVAVINDADAAGLAEAKYGAARDHDGVCLLLTFGTGIGSALLNNEVLSPNTELGHLQFRGMEAEQYAAARLVERDNMDIDWWASRVNEFMQYLDLVLTPKTIVFGGGISKRFDDFSRHFHTRADIVPAMLRNNAGIVGAAMAAAERTAT
jgi:polyphosphate glucokinase